MRTITVTDLKAVLDRGSCEQELRHKIHLLIKRGVVVTDKRKPVEDEWMKQPWGCDMNGCSRLAVWWDPPFRWCDECARNWEKENYNSFPEYTGQA